jgi:hypothetical protein
VALALALSACASAPTGRAPAPPQETLSLEPATRIAHPDLVETSGLVWDGLAFWAHNDSGAAPVLYRSGSPDFQRADALPVPDAELLDWEDLALLDGDLLVCDTGDNQLARDHVMIYRVRYHPADGAAPARLETVARAPVRYPDGPHDCEGAAVISGRLHLFTKGRGEPTHRGVYRVGSLLDRERLPPGGANEAVLLGTLHLPAGAQITAACVDRDAGLVVLLGYDRIAVYPASSPWGPPLRQVGVSLKQCEALCVRDGALVIANEQRDVYLLDGWHRGGGAR